MSKSKQNHHVAHATEVQPGAMSLVFLWKMSKIRNLLGAVSLVFLWKMSNFPLENVENPKSAGGRVSGVPLENVENPKSTRGRVSGFLLETVVLPATIRC